MFECTPQHGKQEPTFFPRATVPAGLLKKGFFTDLPGNVQEQLGMVPTLSREAVKEEERETVAREAAQDDEREAAKEERREEEEGVALPMQTKLRVSSPDDPTEREADEMADRMMTMPLQREVVGRETVDPEPETVAPIASPGWASPEAISTGGALRLGGASVVGREAAKEEEREGVSREASEDALQTKCADCEAEEKDTLSRQETPEEDTVAAKLQRKVDMSGATVDAATAAQINSVRSSGGQPLAKADREYFEERMDTDFSNVRVHTNAAANETAGAVQARAFTLGRDIVFNQSEYRPETSDGKRLLAHELTHTIQQGAAVSRSVRRKYQGAARSLLQQPNTEQIYESPRIVACNHLTLFRSPECNAHVPQNYACLSNRIVEQNDREISHVQNLWRALESLYPEEIGARDRDRKISILRDEVLRLNLQALGPLSTDPNWDRRLPPTMRLRVPSRNRAAEILRQMERRPDELNIDSYPDPAARFIKALQFIATAAGYASTYQTSLHTQWLHGTLLPRSLVGTPARAVLHELLRVALIAERAIQRMPATAKYYHYIVHRYIDFLGIMRIAENRWIGRAGTGAAIVAGALSFNLAIINLEKMKELIKENNLDIFWATSNASRVTEIVAMLTHENRLSANWHVIARELFAATDSRPIDATFLETILKHYGVSQISRGNLEALRSSLMGLQTHKRRAIERFMKEYDGQAREYSTNIVNVSGALASLMNTAPTLIYSLIAALATWDLGGGSMLISQIHDLASSASADRRTVIANAIFEAPETGTLLEFFYRYKDTEDAINRLLQKYPFEGFVY